MTTHDIILGNSQQMGRVASCSIDLIVTSPPYPMVQMWDGLWGVSDIECDPMRVHESMHRELDKVWAECFRYVTRENDEQFDLSPIAERKALEDAKIIVDNIVYANEPKKDDRLLKEGSPAPDDAIVCRAKIAIRWDRKLKMATYHRAGYERFLWEAKWQPVAALMMEQYDYTFDVLRKRENAERKQKEKKKNEKTSINSNNR